MMTSVSYGCYETMLDIDEFTAILDDERIVFGPSDNAHYSLVIHE